MKIPRRTLLLSLSALALAALPFRLFAAAAREAFAAKTLPEALRAYHAAGAAESREILIEAPEIAENGGKVEVDITSQIAGTRSMAVFADKNPLPLAAVLEFSGNALPFVRLPLRLAETTRIRVVVKTTEGKTWLASREIRVVLGGCGPKAEAEGRM